MLVCIVVVGGVISCHFNISMTLLTQINSKTLYDYCLHMVWSQLEQDDIKDNNIYKTSYDHR